MKKKKLSDVAYIKIGQPAPKIEDIGTGRTDSKIPFIRAGSLDRLLSGVSECDLELVDDITAKKYKLKIQPGGSLIFAKSGMSGGWKSRRSRICPRAAEFYS